MFLRRVILQSRSDGEAKLIQSKALELEQLLQTMPIAGELPIEEECPACKSKIPFGDIRTATCQKGHPWSEYLKVDFSERFCSLTCGKSSPMLNHHVRTCNFSGANVPRMHAQGVFSCSVKSRESPIDGRREPVDSWGATSRDPMRILRESLRVLTIAFFASFRNLSQLHVTLHVRFSPGHV